MVGLKIEDKKFIPPRDAAKISGYDSDYVGQLCRLGKLECKRVGRAWFVNEDSLLKHCASKGNEKPFQVEEISKETPTQENPSNGEVYNFSEFDRNNKPLLKKTVVSTEDSNVLKTAEKTIEIRESLVVSGKTENGGVVSSTEKTSTLNNLGNGIHLPNFSEIKFSQIISIPSKDFFHKTISILVAFVIVFGAYAFRDSGYIDDGVSLFSKGISSVKTLVVEISNIDSNDIKQFAFNANKSLNTYFGEKTKSAKNTSSKILTSAVLKLRDITSTVSFAVSDFKNHPINFTKDSSETFFRGTVLSFKELKESAEDIAVGSGKTFSKVEGLAVSIFRSVGDSLYAGVVEVSNDPFISVKTLARNFNIEVNSLFRSGIKIVSSLWEPNINPEIVLKVPPRKTLSQNVPTSVIVEGPRTIVRTVTENITYKGISREEVEQMVSALNGTLRQEIYKLTGVTAGNSVYINNVYNAVAQTNRIDQLHGVNFNNGVINNSTINGGSISGATLSGSSFSDSLSIGGNLTVSGTGTSTFAGDSSFDGGVLYIDSVNNRVGVATTTPQFTFDVDGIINASALYVNGAPYIGSQWTSTSSDIYFDSGKVGIGTSSPSELLSVNGAIYIASSTPAVGASRLYNNQGDLYWNGNLIAGGAVGNWTGADGNVYRTSGNVGIGTTSPFATLSVAGIGSFDDYVRASYFTATSTTATSTFAGGMNVAGSSGLTVLQNGNVGVGTSTPSSKLSLSGGNFTHTAGGNPTLAGTYDTSGNTYGVYISGKYAYVADGTSGLQIIDISNPNSPVIIGTYNTSGTAYDVHVSGNYAYVADGNTSGLRIIDISNPTSPTQVGSNTALNYAYNIYVSGKYAFLAYGTSGLRIIDVSNPLSPKFLTQHDTSGTARDVYVSGKYAYIADGPSGLQVVDISNPASPVTVGTYGTAGAYGVYVSGNYAYVADGGSGLQIIDISNPVNPTLVGTYDTSGNAYGVYVSGKYAYVAYMSSGLHVVDISNPVNPTLVGTYDTSGNAYGVYISGKYAYVADGTSGLQIIDVNGIETPSLYAGNINTNALTVTENVDIGNNLFVRNGLNVGAGGIFTDGSLSVAGTTTSSYFGGNVGIGTTSPYAKLSVVGQTVSEYFTATSTTATSTFPNLSLTNLLFGSDYLTDITGSGLSISNGALVVSGFASTTFANMLAGFDASGNLTSTSSPQVAYINATSTTATSTFAGGMSVAGTTGLNVLQNGRVAIGASYSPWSAPFYTLNSSNSGSSPLAIFSGGANGQEAFIDIRSTTNGGNGRHIGLVNKAEGNLFQISNWTGSVLEPKVTLNYNTGNFGIGTTSPFTTLSVAGIGSFDDYVRASYFTATSTTATSTFGGVLSVGSTTPAGNALFSVGTSTQNLFVDKRSGNVGIGTTNPGGKLSVTEANGATSVIPALGVSGGTFQILSDASRYGLIMGSINNGNSFLQSQRVDGTATGYNMLLQPNGGNVGIGTTSPYAKLSVKGGGTTTGVNFQTTNSSNSPLVTFLDSGNVGIGTSTPNSKLALVGGNFTHTASGNPTLKGTYNTSGTAYDVFISGKYAYIADGTSGLQIMDISNPASPTLTGTYNTSGDAFGVYVSGKYAYVADQASGLQIIDISNPASPILTGTYDTTANASGVYVSGKYAYVTEGGAGLEIVDISNPTSPTQVGSYDTSGYANFGIYVSGKYAYVADDYSGLQIIDISNPASPILTGTYDTSGYPFGVYVSGKYAYVGDSGSGLQIVDISNPASPTLTGTYNTSGDALGVYVSGKYAYVGDSGSGLQIVDISNPVIPTLVGTYDTPGQALNVYVSGKYAYVADTYYGLQIIDINGIETPSLYAGNIATNDLTVTENGDFGNNLFVRNGLNVGMGGIFTDGVLSVTGTTSSSYFGGNVGIGTTSPYAKLSVVGQTVSEYFTATSTTATSTFGGVLSVGSTTPAGNALFSVGTSTQNLFVDKNSGNVGIGTSNASSPLTVRGVSANSVLANFVSNSGAGILQIYNANTESTPVPRLIGTNSYINIYEGVAVRKTSGGGDIFNVLDSANASKFIVNSTGNVGIGTTSPYAKLSVVGQAVAEYFTATSTTATSTFGGVLSVGSTTPAGNALFSVGTSTQNLFVDKNSGNVGIGTSSPYRQLSISNSAQIDQYLYVGSPSGINQILGNSEILVRYGASTRASLIQNATSNGNANGGLKLGNGTTFGYVGSNGLGDILLNGAGVGNVGIGTTSPTAKLNVYGNTNIDGVLRLGIQEDALGVSRGMTITPGAYNSNQYITAYNNSGAGLMFQTYNTGFGTSTTNIFMEPSGRYISFGTATSTANAAIERMRIDGNGYLGIGTTSPYAKLSVVGQVVGEYFTATSTTATSTFPNLSLTNLLFGSDYLTDITGSGLSISNGALSVTGASISGAANMLAGFDASGNLTSTSSPQVAYINATSTTATSTFAGGLSVGSTAFNVLRNNSYVGIGTLSPNTGLHLYSDVGNYQMMIERVSAGGDATMHFKTSVAEYGLGIDSSDNAFKIGVTSGDIANVNSFVIKNTNVGIGTTSPYAKLSVVGETVSEYFTATSTTATSTFPNLSLTNLLFGSDYLTDITGSGLSVSNGALTVIGIASSTLANTFASFDSSGNLIGSSTLSVVYGGTGLSTAPSYGQILVGNSSGGYTLTSTSTWTFASSTILSDNNTFSGSNIFSSLTATSLQLPAGFSNMLAGFDASGNLTSTSSPQVAYINATSTTATSTFAGGMNVGSGNFVYDYSTGVTSINSLETGNLNFEADAGVVSWVDLPISSALAGTPQSYTAQIGNQAVMTVYGESDGAGASKNLRVGIGTTTPWARLSVSGTTTSSTSYAFAVADVASTTRFVIQDDGSVGIGTTTPWGLLSVNPNGISGPSFVVGSSTTTHFTVKNNGQVVIGTDVAGISTALYVNGTARANLFNGPLSSHFNGAGYANFHISSGQTGSTFARGSGVSEYLLPGSSVLAYKNVVGGSYNQALTAGDNFAQMVFGKYGATEATSGNHPILSNLAIRPIDITAGSATVENTASLYIEDSASTTVSSVGNYALWVDNGISRFDGNVGIGTTSPYATLSVSGIGSFDDYVRTSYFTATSTTATSTFPNLSSANLRLSGNLYDSANSQGTNGYVLQTTGTGVSWVATSSLGISGVSTYLGLTDTQSSFTANRIIHTNSAGNALTDTDGFVFTGSNLGIGTTSPQSKFTLSGGNFTHVASGTPILKGSFDTTDTAQDVYISGKYAYVADGMSGLHIIDISNPASPVLMGSYSTGDVTYGVRVSGNYAYLADASSGLKIVDISNPTSPSLVGTYNTAGNALKVYVSGKYAYVADYTSGLTIIDISDPTNPSYVGNYNTSGGAYDVYVSGKYAYVADGTPGLHIIDISTPTNPNLVGTYNTSGSALGVYVSGKYAYVADDSFGLEIINISNSASPSSVGNYVTASIARDVYISGKYAYVADDDAGVYIIDISDPASPTLVSVYDSSGMALGVHVSGKYAYVADELEGLKILDINGIETPSMYAGNIETNYLSVTENIEVGNSLFVRNGLNTGIGGIKTDGTLSVSGTTTSSYFASNVGIGTTSPYAKLSVVGQVVGEYFTATSTTATSTFNGVLSVGSTTPAGNALFSVGTSTQNLFVDKRSGNVGIGTTSPSGKFAIQTGATSGIFTSGNDLMFSNTAGLSWSGSSGNAKLTSSAGSGLNMTLSGSTILAFSRSGGSNARITGTGDIQIWSGNEGSTAGQLYLGSAGVKSYLYTNNTFTIGSTTSYAKLAVYGNAGETNSLLFAVASSTSSATTDHMVVTNSGNVGIATTSPWKVFSVNGAVSMAGLTGSTGAGSICLSANNELVYNAGSDACLPSLRETKHDIEDLTIDSLSILRSINPVSFVYNDGDGKVRYGFIAEDASSIDPRLATYNEKGEISGIDDRALIAVSIKAIKEMDIKLADIEARMASSTPSVGNVNESGIISSILSFFEGLGMKISNGLAQFKKVVVEAFTVGSASQPAGITLYDEETKEPYCFKMRGGMATTTPGICSELTISQTISQTNVATTTSVILPTITLMGNNPANVPLGASYVDLGATGVDKDGNSLMADLVSNNVDTSKVGKYEVVWSVHDSALNYATSSRTVIIFDPYAPIETATSTTPIIVSEETATTTPVVIPIENATSTTPVIIPVSTTTSSVIPTEISTTTPIVTGNATSTNNN